MGRTALLRFSSRLRSVIFLGFLFLAGCADLGGREAISFEEHESAAPAEVSVDLGQTENKSSIALGSTLASLAQELDQVAIQRSVGYQSLEAALAERRSIEFERYPRIVPTASAPIGGGQPSVGLNIEQTLWDGGRVRTRIDNTDLSIDETRVLTWQERNDAVYDGLAAYVDIVRFTERITVQERLLRDLNELEEVLRVRVEGGVADRGEQLRMTMSLQETRRESVSDQSELSAAKAELLRFIPVTNWPSISVELSNVGSFCRRDWSGGDAPEVALARIRLMRAENDYELVRTRRFPSLVLGAGTNISSNGVSEPTATLRLDASDLLGLGRRGAIESADASRIGVRRALELELEDTNAMLQRLEQEYSDLSSSIAQLVGIQRTNVENLDLYREQVVAGTIPVAEGITLFRESANTDLDIIDARAKAVENCLESARIRGTLALVGDLNE